MQAGTVRVHGVFLIACASIPRALKYEALSVGAEIGFRILAAVGELANVREVALAVDGCDNGHGARATQLRACERAGHERRGNECDGCFAHARNIREGRPSQGRPSAFECWLTIQGVRFTAV